MNEENKSMNSDPRVPGGEGTASADLKGLNEPILPDDYPIYDGYLYVADGKVVRSDWHGITARQLRGHLGATELRGCDIYGRKRLREALSKATGGQ